MSETLQRQVRVQPTGFVLYEPKPGQLPIPSVVEKVEAKSASHPVLDSLVNVGKGTVGTAAALAAFFAGGGGPVAGLVALCNGHPLPGLGMAAGGLVIAGACFAVAEKWAPTALEIVSGGAYTPGRAS